MRGIAEVRRKIHTLRQASGTSVLAVSQQPTDVRAGGLGHHHWGGTPAPCKSCDWPTMGGSPGRVAGGREG